MRALLATAFVIASSAAMAQSASPAPSQATLSALNKFSAQACPTGEVRNANGVCVRPTGGGGFGGGGSNMLGWGIAGVGGLGLAAWGIYELSNNDKKAVPITPAGQI